MQTHLCLHALQFGHGCGAVEIQHSELRQTLYDALQFGHGCGAVEI